MADNILGGLKVGIGADWSDLKSDMGNAEAFAKKAGDNIAQAIVAGMGPGMRQATGLVDQFGRAVQSAATQIGAQVKAGAEKAQVALNLIPPAFTRVGQSATQATQQVQSFVGAIPGMGVAAERFINLIPGLGQAIISAFPVLGAIAFAQGLGRVAEAVSTAIDESIGLKKAMDELAEATKGADSALESLGKTVNSLNVDRQTEQFGKSAGLKLKAGLGAADAQAEFVKARELYASADRLEKDFEKSNAVNPGVLIPGVRGDIYAKQKAEIDKLREDAFKAETQGNEKLLKAQKDLDDSTREANTKATDEQKKALKQEQQGWQTRYDLFKAELERVQTLRDAELRGTREFNDKMLAEAEKAQAEETAQREKWKKFNLDAKDTRLKQATFDVDVSNRISGPLAAAVELGRAGILTSQMNQSLIAEDQRLLNMAEQLNVPLGTQLALREDILREEIALGIAQGRNMTREIADLETLQRSQAAMRTRARGFGGAIHQGISDGAGGASGRIGGALASGITGGNIGQEIREALVGIGEQMLGSIFQQLIDQLVATTAVQSVLGLLFSANTLATIANTTAIIWNSVTGLFGFASGGRPPVGVPSVVGERGMEIFVPDTAGTILPNSALSGIGGASFTTINSGGFSGAINISIRETRNGRETARQVARELRSASAKFQTRG